MQLYVATEVQFRILSQDRLAQFGSLPQVQGTTVWTRQGVVLLLELLERSDLEVSARNALVLPAMLPLRG